MLWIQAIGVIGLLMTVYGCTLSNARNTSKIFAIKNLVMVPHYFLLGAFEAMFIEFLCSFRNFATAYFRRNLMIGIAVAYLLAVWAMFLVSNPDNIISYFPAIGTSFGALAGLFRDKIWFYRLSLIVGCSFWVVYLGTHNAWAGLSIEVMVITTILYASIRDLGFIRPIKLRPAVASM